MTKETVAVNLPADRVYSILLNYFKRERMKVKRSVEPSLIEVVAGSLPGNPYDAKMEMIPENGKTRVEFTFDFFKTYFTAFLVLIFGLIILGWLLGPRAIMVTIVIVAMIFAIGAPRSVDRSKKKFMDKVTVSLKDAKQAKR